MADSRSDETSSTQETTKYEIEPTILSFVEELLDADAVSLTCAEHSNDRQGSLQEIVTTDEIKEAINTHEVSQLPSAIPHRIPEIRLSSFDNEEILYCESEHSSKEASADEINKMADLERVEESEPKTTPVEENSQVCDKCETDQKDEVRKVNGVPKSVKQLKGKSPSARKSNRKESLNGDKTVSEEENPKAEEEGGKKSRRRVRISESVDVSDIANEKARPPHCKVAIFLGFVGKNSQGTSNQAWIRRMPSIARDIEDVLVKSGLLPRYRRREIGFSARTARDVSAQRYVISSFIYSDMEPDEKMVELLNNYAPSHIAIFGVRKVVNNFHAKRSCDFFRDPRDIHFYSYYIPSFAFAPVSDDPLSVDYRISKERIEEINCFLSVFEGDHLFHNFTSVLDTTYDAYQSSRRFVVSCRIADVFENGGLELLNIEISGQNFIVFQICTMMGLAVAHFRGNADDSQVSAAWKAPLISLPRAPGLGLVFKSVRYSCYNDRIKKRTEDPKLPLTWEQEDNLSEQFMEKSILPAIVSGELEEQVTLKFVQNLEKHSFEVKVTRQVMKKSLSEEKLSGNGNEQRRRQRSSNSTAS